MRTSVQPARLLLAAAFPVALLFAALPASCRREPAEVAAQPKEDDSVPGEQQGEVAAGEQPDEYADARKAMVKRLRLDGIEDEKVLKVMLETPRHEFVPPDQRPFAYFDHPLPIGEDQTISAPYIVAFMTWKLEPKPTDAVLEIGTGSGYQAAVLAPLVKHVYTIEIVEILGKRAEETLKRLKYENVSVRIGDGYRGWPEHAPFDKIIVTCAPTKLPQPLVDQLKQGGVMVIPYGEKWNQVLYVLEKRDGEMVEKGRLPVLFVPMTGEIEKEGEQEQ
jgi:protein-L-isoaspartate(D-aspartate) O-methyltransferase